MVLAVHHLTEMYRIFKSNAMFLPDHASAVAFEHVQCFLEHYAWLSDDAVARGLQLYPATHAKVHSIFHIGFFSKLINPRFIWAYEGEDFMHTVVNHRLRGVNRDGFHPPRPDPETTHAEKQKRAGTSHNSIQNLRVDRARLTLSCN